MRVRILVTAFACTCLRVDHLRKVSPVRLVEKVRAPILLHGIEDAVVEVEQSRSMNAKLVRAKKKVRFVELKGDDHWLSSASTRTQMLPEIKTFLAQALKPTPAK